MKPWAFFPQNFSKKSPQTRAAQPTFPLIQYHADTCIAFARAPTTWKAHVPQYVIQGEGDEGKEAPGDEHQSPRCPARVAAVPPHLPPPAAAPAVGPEQAACSSSPPLLGISRQARGRRTQKGGRLPEDRHGIAARVTPLNAAPAKTCQSSNLNEV